jgi:hypothetical protein
MKNKNLIIKYSMLSSLSTFNSLSRKILATASPSTTIAIYNFSSAGNGTDSGTYGFNATVYGGVDNTRGRTDGFSLTSNYTQSSSLYVACPNMSSAFNRNNGFTISMWLYIPSSAPTTSGDCTVFGYSDTTCFLNHNANNLRYRFMGLSTMPIELAQAPLDQWNHIVITVSGSNNVSGWANKTSCFTNVNNTSALPPDLNVLTFAKRSSSSNFRSFKGSIDNVRIINMVATQSDVDALYDL